MKRNGRVHSDLIAYADARRLATDHKAQQRWVSIMHLTLDMHYLFSSLFALGVCDNEGCIKAGEFTVLNVVMYS